jgi:alpha-N-arabinofuranosidase
MIDLAHIENKIPVGVRKQKICFDEWNVWTERAYGPNGAEEKLVPLLIPFLLHLLRSIHRYTLSDALAVAVWLNVFIRQSKYIGMANIAQSVNVISPLMTTKDGTIKQTTWWPWFLFCKYMRGSTLSVHVQSGEYEGPTKPAWIRGSIDTPWLDVSAAISDDGVVSLVVVNIGEEKAFKTK